MLATTKLGRPKPSWQQVSKVFWRFLLTRNELRINRRAKQMDNLTQFETTIIKLAKTYSIPPLEWKDIAQELRLNLWIKRDKFDPQKQQYKNWAYIVSKNKIKDLARYYGAKKRGIKKTISLDKLMDEGMDFEG